MNLIYWGRKAFQQWPLLQTLHKGSEGVALQNTFSPSEGDIHPWHDAPVSHRPRLLKSAIHRFMSWSDISSRLFCPITFMHPLTWPAGPTLICSHSNVRGNVDLLGQVHLKEYKNICICTNFHNWWIFNDNAGLLMSQYTIFSTDFIEKTPQLKESVKQWDGWSMMVRQWCLLYSRLYFNHSDRRHASNIPVCWDNEAVKWCLVQHHWSVPSSKTHDAFHLPQDVEPGS